jgi:hypothetical protein
MQHCCTANATATNPSILLNKLNSGLRKHCMMQQSANFSPFLQLQQNANNINNLFRCFVFGTDLAL